jgi:hypothetical protein
VTIDKNGANLAESKRSMPSGKRRSRTHQSKYLYNIIDQDLRR